MIFLVRKYDLFGTSRVVLSHAVIIVLPIMMAKFSSDSQVILARVLRSNRRPRVAMAPDGAASAATSRDLGKREEREFTPVKPGLGTYAGCTTRESVDPFLTTDIPTHSIKDVSFEKFLEVIFQLNVDEWKDALKSFKPKDYKFYMDEYIKEEEKKEPERYGPFSDLVNYIISELKLIGGLEKSELKIHPLGSSPLDSCFPSLRYPDAAGTLFQDLPKLWALILFVIEFKREKTGKRKNADDPTEDSGTQVQKKRKTQSAGNPPISPKPQKKSASQSASNRLRSGQSVAPGFTDSRKMQGVEELVDIHPIPEYPTGKKSNDPEVQLANYALEQLSSDAFRSWTTSILIVKDSLTLWYYDRTRAISTEPISFKQDKKMFVLLVVALVKASLSPKTMGFDERFTLTPKFPGSKKKLRKSSSAKKKKGKSSSSQEEKKEYRYLHVRDLKRHDRLTDIHPTTFTGNHIPNLPFDENTVLRIDYSNSIHRQYTLFGRATRVERIHLGKIDDDGKFVCFSGDHYADNPRGSDGLPPLVLKISNQVEDRTLEHEIVQTARKIDPQHTPAILGYGTMDENLPGDDFVCKVNPPIGEKVIYEKRHLVFLVMREYRHAWELVGSCRDLMSVLQQILVCHRSLYCKAGILHRDLSATNVMFHQVSGVLFGILNDFDHAIILSQNGEVRQSTSRHRTGTAPYMARDLLLMIPGLPVNHIYAYELESFFYVTLSFMLGYRDRPPRSNPLQEFFNKDWAVVEKAKSHFFSSGTEGTYMYIIERNTKPERWSYEGMKAADEMCRVFREHNVWWELERLKKNQKGLHETYKLRFRKMQEIVTFERISKAFGEEMFGGDFENIKELYDEPSFGVTCS